jgi:hypothetical protein
LIVSDTNNFSVDAGKLPAQLLPGATITINVCFHPRNAGAFTGSIDWSTDLEASFAHSVKSRSLLSGTAIARLGVSSSMPANVFSIRPNPANGNSVIVTFDKVRPAEKSTLSMFDVLGREVYRQEIFSGVTQTEIPIRRISEGVYYVQLASPAGTVSQRFIKTK